MFVFVTAYEKYSVLSAIYSHSNFLLACHDSVVILSDITGSDVSTHFPHEVALSDVKTCDMKTFVTIASDKIIRVWDISKEDIQKKLQTQENKIRYYFGDILQCTYVYYHVKFNINQFLPNCTIQ